MPMRGRIMYPSMGLCPSRKVGYGKVTGGGERRECDFFFSFFSSAWARIFWGRRGFWVGGIVVLLVLLCSVVKQAMQEPHHSG